VVVWTEHSLTNAQEIAFWIESKFSVKEVKNFHELLRGFERIMQYFPDMYPESRSKPGLHQTVLHKNLSVYYWLDKACVTVVAIKDNRREE